MTAWLAVRAPSIPAELRALRWVLWRAEPRDRDKPAKVPYCVTTPTRRASSTDPGTWSTFTDAIETYLARSAEPADPQRGPIAGIGVVLTRDAGVTCLDLDRVLGPDSELDSRAQTIVDRCESWTERSPSGAGLHVFVGGAVPRAIKGPQIEVYSSERYICVTGHQWPGTPNGLRPQQAYLDHLVQVAEAAEPRRRPWTGPATPAPDDLAGALLAKLARWGIPTTRLKQWGHGFLVELVECPWADEHTTGRGGAAVMVRASGAFDFTCLHAHCGGRSWRDFRSVMDGLR
jgi:hypothetical protein